jgi:hypothetical protein
MSCPQSAFRAGFCRQISSDRQLQQAIQSCFARLEPDATYTLRLNCDRISYPVLIGELSKITKGVLSLGTFRVIEIDDGEKIHAYAIEDLALLDSSILDRLHEQEQTI